MRIINDGRTHAAKIRTAPGGVGRNMAEALRKLGLDPVLLSAVGNDVFGRELMLRFSEKKLDISRLNVLSKDSSLSTAVYSAVLKSDGECLFGVGEMDIHESGITSAYLREHRSLLESAPLVVMDGNISVEAMTTILEICSGANTPVWFEPTEVRKARKVCRVEPAQRQWFQAIRYLSPNGRELKGIVEEAKERGTISGSGSKAKVRFLKKGVEEPEEELEDVADCFRIFPKLEMVLVTKGEKGIVVIFKTAREPDSDWITLDSIWHPKPSLHPQSILSVSGAGDCLNAGVILGVLKRPPWATCARIGTKCAEASLQSLENVPGSFSL